MHQAGQDPRAESTPIQQAQHTQQQIQQLKQQIQLANAAPHPSWRLELFFKSTEELRSQLPFLRWVLCPTLLPVHLPGLPYFVVITVAMVKLLAQPGHLCC
jgi:hypothetical protein